MRMRAMQPVSLAMFLTAFSDAIPPDPGSWRTYNPAVTQATIDKTICVPYYTAAIRPPLYVTQRIKKMLLAARGLDWSHAREFQLDHVIALELGGEPGDAHHTSNLQLLEWPIARRKDRVAHVAKQCVCNRQVTLAEARRDLEDWQTAYRKYAKMVCRRPR